MRVWAKCSGVIRQAWLVLKLGAKLRPCRLPCSNAACVSCTRACGLGWRCPTRLRLTGRWTRATPAVSVLRAHLSGVAGHLHVRRHNLGSNGALRNKNVQYIYLDNVRGFTRTLIPIRACNFLVGENSTGKSSFLSLLRLLSRPDFLFQSQISLDADSPSAFSDLVSAWASDKSYFDIGMLDVDMRAGGRPKLSYRVHRFSESSGVPVTSQYIQRRSSNAVHLRFTRTSTEYFRTGDLSEPSDEIACVAEFRAAVATLDSPSVKFTRLPRQFSGFPPVAYAMSVVSSLRQGSKPNSRELQFEVPSVRPLTWIAPIRSKPQRIYDGLTRDYSAEGAHSPFVLKQQLKSTAFVEKLREFGKASGLFEVLSTHTFGKGVRNPFEVLIQLSGESFNIENVGYGVSQALPLIVEFLATKTASRFAVQQPEVHLHPRAQAALGSLLFWLAQEKQHTFVVETHSDYLIDRFRLEMSTSATERAPDSQILFFSRSDSGNSVSELRIAPDGLLPVDQPKEFREFFIREEMRLLSL